MKRISASLFFSLLTIANWAGAQNAGPLTCSGSTLISLSGPRVSIPLRSSAECRALVEVAQYAEDKEFLASNLSERALTSEDEMKAFENARPDEAIGFPQKKCRVEADDNHLTQSQNGYIIPECAPDTLYSWGGFEKLKALLIHMEDGTPWTQPFPRTIFTTHSAAGTFGYGAIPVRFKIKPGVKFKLLVTPRAHGCEEYLRYRHVSESDIQNTIVAKVFKEATYSYLEYSICSPAVIDSWSFAMHPHYDEILADHQWMTTKDSSEWEAYSKYLGKNMYIENTIDQQNGTDFRLSTFRTNMKLLQALTKGGFGKVIFPTKYWRRTVQVEKHFQTEKPIYFNPK